MTFHSKFRSQFVAFLINIVTVVNLTINFYLVIHNNSSLYGALTTLVQENLCGNHCGAHKDVNEWCNIRKGIAYRPIGCSGCRNGSRHVYRSGCRRGWSNGSFKPVTLVFEAATGITLLCGHSWNGFASFLRTIITLGLNLK